MQSLITRIHHVSIVVTNLEASRHFYGHVLGLREIARPATFDFVVVWYDLGGQHLHLVPRETADAASPRHFAFEVEDAGAARQHLARFGLPTRETTPIPGCDRFFVHDPDDNLIEIMHWSRPYRPETDGIGSGTSVPASPTADRFEPALMPRAQPASPTQSEE